MAGPAQLMGIGSPVGEALHRLVLPSPPCRTNASFWVAPLAETEQGLPDRRRRALRLLSASLARSAAAGRPSPPLPRLPLTSNSNHTQLIHNRTNLTNPHGNITAAF